MSFQHCLNALARKVASTPLLRLVATFLTNRSMTVRVSDTWSAPRPVDSGCLQGSILGFFFLFNATIDDLEEGCTDLEHSVPQVTSFTDESESQEDSPASSNDELVGSTPVAGRRGWISSPDASPCSFMDASGRGGPF